MEAMEDILVIVGLIGVQLLCAGTSILLGYFLKLGLQPFDLIIFANVATFLVLFPLSISFERGKWPKTIGYSLSFELFLLSFGGVTVYQSLLVDSSDTLNSLLEKASSGSEHTESSAGSDSEPRSPISRRLLALITSLESNIEEKAKLYENSAMRCIFLMNNILYIVQKVKDTELQNLLGVEWIKKRRELIRQYATKYLRAAWSQALSYLKDEGMGGSSSSASKVALKERFKNFNACFEDIYRIQTAWRVHDSQLAKISGYPFHKR